MGLIHCTTPNVLTAFSFTAFGLASFASAYKPFPTDLTESMYYDETGSMLGQVHPRETKLEQLVSPWFYESFFGNPENPKNYLTFDKNDLREKFLFLSADEDQSGLLDPQNILGLLKDINKIYDLKYRVVKSVDDVCREVKEASQLGKVSNVFIDAYSDSSGMCLSNCKSQRGWLHKFFDYKDCFKGMDPNGKITLYGSKTGENVAGNPKDNIAQKIATDSKIQVIATIDHVSPSGIQVSNVKGDFEVYQKNQNKDKLFKSFQPVFDKCTNIKHPLHPREKEAMEVVKKEVTENSQIIHPDEFESHILKMCKDNPKKKFLFLSMEADHNGALNPKNNPELFKTLPKNYDFKFKVIRSYDELCIEARGASILGEEAHLVIHGHGERKGIHITGDNKLENWMHVHMYHPSYKNFSCLRDISPSTKITLLTCKSAEPNGAGNPNDNIASLISKNTGKMVVAPTEFLWTHLIKINSLNEFDVFHESENNKKENIFKKFNPERIDDKK